MRQLHFLRKEGSNRKMLQDSHGKKKGNTSLLPFAIPDYNWGSNMFSGCGFPEEFLFHSTFRIALFTCFNILHQGLTFSLSLSSFLPSFLPSLLSFFLSSASVSISHVERLKLHDTTNIVTGLQVLVKIWRECESVNSIGSHNLPAAETQPPRSNHRK